MTIINDARALLAVLQPMTGSRAAGPVIVNAVSGPAVLPANSYGVPVINGSIRYDILLKTLPNPADPAGWPVASGTSVPIVSNVGGVPQNVPAGSLVRWWPSVPGIEVQSVVGPAGITGGVNQSGLVAVQELAFFEELQASKPSAQLLHSMVSRFPAIVLAWEKTGESRGVGNNRYLFPHTWGLYVVTSRLDADPSRRLEGIAIMDEASDTLWGRQSVDGFHFSTPSGCDITARQRIVTDPKFFIYRVQVETWAAQNGREARTFNPWIRTKMDLTTTDDPPLPIVADNQFLMPQ